MKLQLFERNVYGRQIMYPVGDMYRHVETLTRKKTIDSRDLNALVELGVEIEWVKDPNSINQ
jgi:hypothetical protein